MKLSKDCKVTEFNCAECIVQMLQSKMLPTSLTAGFFDQDFVNSVPIRFTCESSILGCICIPTLPLADESHFL